jgi:hypothetical protein
MKDFDFYGDQPVTLVSVQVPNDRLPREVFWIPALVLLGLVLWVQYRRAAKHPGPRPRPVPSQA